MMGVRSGSGSDSGSSLGSGSGSGSDSGSGSGSDSVQVQVQATGLPGHADTVGEWQQQVSLVIRVINAITTSRNYA
jgi:hypothetical protein